MAGIEEHADAGALQAFGELPDGPVHAALVEIDALYDLEPQPFRSGGDVGGVVLRVAEHGGIAVSRVADHERNAAFGSESSRDAAGGEHEQHRRIP